MYEADINRLDEELALLKKKPKGKRVGTGIEIKVEKLLCEKGLPYVSQVRMGKVGIADFLVYNIVIEVDGEYWHSFDIAQKRDKEKDLLLKHRGFQIVRLKEGLINSDIQACWELIQSALTRIRIEGNPLTISGRNLKENRLYILHDLLKTTKNRSEIARELGIHRKTLYRWLQKEASKGGENNERGN